MFNPSNGGAQVVSSRNVPFTPITRQPSIYSLTLDEFQNAIEAGKNFGSMNMDEFLKSVWTAEETQAMASAMGGATESANPQPGGLARQSSITQGSLSLPRTLIRKTVDEVWRDIQRGPEQAKEQQRENNYGEMTLEDFLVKAGVVREEAEASPGVSNNINSFASFGSGLGAGFQAANPLAQVSHQATMEAMAQNQQQHQADWLSYQFKNASMQQHQQMLQQQAEAAAAYASVAKRGGTSTALALPGTPSGSGMDGSSDGGLGHANGLSLSPAITRPGTPTRGKKRGPEMVVEKTVERRQRRMIKNRESAARSRARKQAYTVELEAEVTQLKEENMRLKKQQAEDAERSRKQILENLIPVTQHQPKTRILRRTRTNPW